MKALLVVLALTLAGCSSFGGVSVGKTYIGYENDKYKALVEKVPTDNPKLTHVRTTVDPKAGQRLPMITGDVQNTVTGGKQANIYIETQ